MSDEFRLQVDPPWRARYAALEERLERIERVLVTAHMFAAQHEHPWAAAVRADVEAIRAELPAAVEASDEETATPHRIESER